MTRRGNHGFTFIEMTVVLLIIAISTALIVPMVEGGFTSREVRRAARQIASTMHYCRGEAVALGEPQELVIDPARNSLHTTGWGRWVVLTDRAAIEAVQGGVDLGQGAVQILFFPNGSTSGAEVVVANRNDPRLNRLRIQLDPMLGTVWVKDDTA